MDYLGEKINAVGRGSAEDLTPNFPCRVGCWRRTRATPHAALS